MRRSWPHTAASPSPRRFHIRRCPHHRLTSRRTREGCRAAVLLARRRTPTPALRRAPPPRSIVVGVQTAGGSFFERARKRQRRRTRAEPLACLDVEPIVNASV